MTHSPILALAPNGAYKQKSDHPELPISEAEIVRVAADAFAEGVSMLHLHIRDQNHLHSLDADTYRRTIDAIRDELGAELIIQISSESGKRYSAREQSATIQKVNPEAVSIALRELVPNKNDLHTAQSLFYWCAEQECRPQFIIYTENELLDYLDYSSRDIIPAAPHSLLFALGRYQHNQPSRPDELGKFLSHCDSFSAPWMICAFGYTELSCMVAAIENGGHARTGFETSLHHEDGRIATDNIDKVRKLKQAGKRSGLSFATPQQARDLLNIR